jgi:phosphoribosylformimino-5-aminoimidazole carboxamide ribotide isomerase
VKVIPVIDLKDGIVVSAKKGQRNHYQPIQSPSSAIDDIIRYFLSIYPFDTLYIADLNAITSSGNNQRLIDSIARDYKNIEFWVDNGQKIQSLPKPNTINYKLVIGSESQDEVAYIENNQSLKNNILSLDYFPNKGYTGPKYLLENATLWPDDIIIMSLACVGNTHGPDIERLRDFCQQYPEKNFIAAGGVRNEADLLQLRSIGIHHALVASSLYSGAMTAETIKNLQAKKCPD